MSSEERVKDKIPQKVLLHNIHIYSFTIKYYCDKTIIS